MKSLSTVLSLDHGNDKPRILLVPVHMTIHRLCILEGGNFDPFKPTIL